MVCKMPHTVLERGFLCTVCCVCHSSSSMYAMYNFPTIHLLHFGSHDDKSAHPPYRTSSPPRPVLTLGAPNLALLEQTLPSPLTPWRIHIPRRLHRDSSSRSLGWNLLPHTCFQLRHLDMFSRVKLKRWLRTQNLEVQLGSWMRHMYESSQR